MVQFAVVLMLAVAAAGCWLQAAEARLVLVYSVQRHGARNVLPKSADLKESDATAGPTLLAQGQRQCFEAGLAFNSRYINSSTCAASGTCLAADPAAVLYGVTGTDGVGFSNYNLGANSSALDRTIMSADSFFAGVFPGRLNATNSSYLPSGQQLVPVYSVADSEDWRIRGYTKCNAYQARLDAWLRSSPDFRAKEQQTADFRMRVQQQVPQLNTSLSNLWNVYDAFSVWRTYQVGDQMPPVDEQTFEQIVDIAMWLETSKMSPQLTGNLLGGALLGDLLARLAAAEAAVTAGSNNYYRLLSISSHYNSQLGLLSALEASSQQPAPADYAWRHKIPATAAVLVFELHSSSSAPLGGEGDAAGTNGQEGSGFAVRAVYQDGPKAQYAVLPLPCAVAKDAAEQLAGAGSCTLQRFKALAGPQALNSSSDWCEACSNSKVMACQVHAMARQLAALGVDPAAAAGGSSSSGTAVDMRSPGMIFVWCLVSVLAAALLTSSGLLAVRKIRRKGSKQQQQQAPQGVDRWTVSAADVL